MRESGGAAEPLSYNAGDTVSGLQFSAVNPTNGASNGSWTYKVFLSTDDVIAPSGDDRLDTQSFTWNFSSMSQVNVTLGSVIIPIGTSNGTFWLGTRFLNSTDNTASNNETSGWDALEIQVTKVADPAAGASLPLTTEVAAGEFLDVMLDYSNNGAKGVHGDLEIRASANQNITSGDPLLAIVNAGWLNGLGSWSNQQSIQIPDSLADGIYYIGFIVTTPSNDADMGNNAISSSVTFTKVTRPVNNECLNALLIDIGDTAFSTIGATTDGPQEFDCFGGVTANDIWYTYTSPINGNLTVSMCNQADFNTEIVVYSGSFASRVLLGCNDDTIGCASNTLLVEVPVVMGTSYLIRVGGWSVSTMGSGTLTVGVVSGILGDVNNDGVVNVADLLLVIAGWGGVGADGTDLDGDGVVNVNDLLILIANWS